MTVLALLAAGTSLAGTYRWTNGFETYTLILEAGGRASMAWKPDHPGGSITTGTWRVKDELVVTRMLLINDKSKSRTDTLVPVTWGDREYLIYEEEIRDFAGLALRWLDRNTTEKAMRSEVYEGPFLKAKVKEGKRYGKPIAPQKYAPWFEWGGNMSAKRG